MDIHDSKLRHIRISIIYFQVHKELNNNADSQDRIYRRLVEQYVFIISLLPWGLRQDVPLKSQLSSTRQDGITSADSHESPMSYN